MRLPVTPTLMLICGLAGCTAPLPDPQSELSQAALDAPWPDLVPLDPILAESDAPLSRDPAAEGQALEARAEALRRRAALLQAQDTP